MPSHPQPPTLHGRGFRILAVVGCALALAGCASVVRVDNDVQSYARWANGGAPAAGERFRFERLPSQDAQAAAEQQALEMAVARRLEAAGLKAAGADGADAAWRVEVSARSQRFPHAPWDNPWDRWPGAGLAGRDHVVTRKGQVIAVPVFPMPSAPYYKREISLVIRDAAQGRAVFESRAAHDGPWPSSPAMWDALANAVLDGFPQPPSGPRKVYVDVPR